MSLPQFPVLPGVDWNIQKGGLTNTRLLEADSGAEYRAQQWSSPRWKFSLPFQFLRQKGMYTEYQTLQGFVLQMAGQFNNFIYSDPFDNTATAQGCGVGNGVATQFPVVRTFGGYVEPVLYLNTVSAVYLSGVLQTSGYTIVQTGKYGPDTIQFTSAPSSGVTVSADFTFYFVCRFLNDDNMFGNFLKGNWEMKGLDFESVK